MADRRIGKWIAALLLAAAVLVVVDRVAAYLATSELARSVEGSQHLAVRPRVVIHGFPFLTQVIRGRYQQVDVSSGGTITAGSVALTGSNARLYGVEVNLIDALHGTVKHVPVRSGSGSAVITYTALNSAIRAKLGSVGQSFSVGPSGSGQITLHGPLGTSLSLAASVSSGKLSLIPDPGAIDDLPETIAQPLRNALGAPIALPTFPYNLHLTSGRITRQGITLSATANHSVFPVK